MGISDFLCERWDSPTAGKHSTGLFSIPPFEPYLLLK